MAFRIIFPENVDVSYLYKKSCLILNEEMINKLAGNFGCKTSFNDKNVLDVIGN